MDEVTPFMTSLMGGRTPSDEIMHGVRAHYEAIGGKSPLVDIGVQILDALRVRLGSDTPVELGMLHSAPYVDDAIDTLVKQGVTRVVAVSMSPFYSTASNGRAFSAVEESINRHTGVGLIKASTFGSTIGFVVAHASALAEAMLGVPTGTPVFFSAHSLPMPDVEAGDQVYVDGLQLAASAVADTLGFEPADEEGFLIGDDIAFGTTQGDHPWAVVFQSQGVRGDRWLTPTLMDAVTETAAAGCEGLIVCPLGFATDHMETLYDLDIKTKKYAEEDAGLAFVRSAAPNNAPALIDAIEDVISLAQGR